MAGVDRLSVYEFIVPDEVIVPRFYGGLYKRFVDVRDACPSVGGLLVSGNSLWYIVDCGFSKRMFYRDHSSDAFIQPGGGVEFRIVSDGFTTATPQILETHRAHSNPNVALAGIMIASGAPAYLYASEYHSGFYNAALHENAVHVTRFYGTHEPVPFYHVKIDSFLVDWSELEVAGRIASTLLGSEPYSYFNIRYGAVHDMAQILIETPLGYANVYATNTRTAVIEIYDKRVRPHIVNLERYDGDKVKFIEKISWWLTRLLAELSFNKL